MKKQVKFKIQISSLRIHPDFRPKLGFPIGPWRPKRDDIIGSENKIRNRKTFAKLQQKSSKLLGTCVLKLCHKPPGPMGYPWPV